MDVAEQFLRAGHRDRAAAIAATIDAAAMSMTGQDRATILGLVADVHLDLGNRLAALTAVAEAVASAGSCELIARIILLTSAVETYLSLDDHARAREILEQARRDLLVSDEANNDILCLCIARRLAA